jgi:hypothetical protein
VGDTLEVLELVEVGIVEVGVVEDALVFKAMTPPATAAGVVLFVVFWAAATYAARLSPDALWPHQLLYIHQDSGVKLTEG